MRFTAALILQAVLGSCSTLPGTYVLHERNHKLSRRGLDIRMDPNVQMPMRIGLKQNDTALDLAEGWLMEVSDPKSAKYGQHWTQDQVIDAFRPSAERVDTVTRWLVSSGIAQERITHSDNKQWLAFDASVKEAEGLLKTQYFHDGKDQSLVGCLEYHIPDYLTAHIDYVTPAAKPVKLALKSAKKKKRSNDKRTIGRPKPFAVGTSNKAKPTNPSDISHCDTAMNPACVRALYKFPQPDPKAKVNPNNSLGIFEEGDFYAQEDLDSYFTMFAPWIPNGTGPIPELVDGAVAPVPLDQAGTESSLDFQLAFPIVFPQKIDLWQVDDAFEADATQGFLNTWLDALDGSYCTLEAFGEKGDSSIDPVYPDPNPAGFQGKTMCGTFKPTYVISNSYGPQENDLPVNYQKRQCLEYLKLGLQGTSLFFASGDTGVASLDDQSCLGPDNTIFSPQAPCTCPYVTAVGATTIPAGKTPSDPESAPDHFIARANVTFFSGGGFSNIFPVPWYQQSTVSNYFAKHNPPYPSYSTTDGNLNHTGKGIYNRIGRPYPDVAANGDNWPIFVGGNLEQHVGTSASTPIFASIINLIVEERLKVGKGPLGFINPVLYQHPEVLNDIVNGSNPGCGTNGFQTEEGWDPVTGLGTPNYPAMLKLFLSLP